MRVLVATTAGAGHFDRWSHSPWRARRRATKCELRHLCR